MSATLNRQSGAPAVIVKILLAGVFLFVIYLALKNIPASRHIGIQIIASAIQLEFEVEPGGSFQLTRSTDFDKIRLTSFKKISLRSRDEIKTSSGRSLKRRDNGLIVLEALQDSSFAAISTDFPEVAGQLDKIRIPLQGRARLSLSSHKYSTNSPRQTRTKFRIATWIPGKNRNNLSINIFPNRFLRMETGRQVRASTHGVPGSLMNPRLENFRTPGNFPIVVSFREFPPNNPGQSIEIDLTLRPVQNPLIEFEEGQIVKIAHIKFLRNSTYRGSSIMGNESRITFFDREGKPLAKSAEKIPRATRLKIDQLEDFKLQGLKLTSNGHIKVNAQGYAKTIELDKIPRKLSVYDKYSEYFNMLAIILGSLFSLYQVFKEIQRKRLNDLEPGPEVPPTDEETEKPMEKHSLVPGEKAKARSIHGKSRQVGRSTSKQNRKRPAADNQ